jgi:hypothetical protein
VLLELILIKLLYHGEANEILNSLVMHTSQPHVWQALRPALQEEQGKYEAALYFSKE